MMINDYHCLLQYDDHNDHDDHDDHDDHGQHADGCNDDHDVNKDATICEDDEQLSML